MSAAPSARASTTFRAGLLVASIVGLSLGICLAIYFGLAEIGNALATAGWRSIIVLAAAHLVALALCASAWRILLPETKRPHPYRHFLWARWIRESIGNVIAIVPAAGEAAGARALSMCGLPASVAAATTIVDMTTEMLGQLIYTLIGLGFLSFYRPDQQSVQWGAIGLAVATVAVVGFLVAQKRGLIRFLETVPSKLGFTQSLRGVSDAESIHAAIQSVYRQNGRIVASVAIHLLAWFAGAAEAWVALWFLDQTLTLGEVLSLESLVVALRTIAFVVPWSVGVQEGGYVVVGALFGLRPEVALALSLLLRGRDLATGIPGLLAWQGVEGMRLWRRRLFASNKLTNL